MNKKIHRAKVLKIIELGLLVALEIVFVVILMVNKTMRSSIFIDKSLFTICAIMYVTLLVVLASFVIDFISLRNLKIEGHNLEELAYYDNKTGMPNRTSCTMLFDTFASPDSMKGIGCIVTEIVNIRKINSDNGKAYGDKVIRDFSQMFEESAKGFGFVGRNGGNEFISVIENCDADRMAQFYGKLSDAVSAYNADVDKCNIEIHSEYVLYDSEKTDTFSELVARAYAKLRK